MLYERRFGPFFVEPIVAGLDPVTFKPYICNMVSGMFDVTWCDIELQFLMNLVMAGPDWLHH